MNRLSTEKRAQIVGMMIEGNSIRSITRMTGICQEAITKLLCDLGKACADHHNAAKVIGIRTAVLSGNPDSDHISTSFVERQNLSLRMSLRRFTRLTNAFSKKFANHCHAVAIYYTYYNFCRVHQTLRVTPAMEA